jgi:hypothetical protein
MPKITYETDSQTLTIQDPDSPTAESEPARLVFSAHGTQLRQWQDFLQLLKAVFPEVDQISQQANVRIEGVRLDSVVVEEIKKLGKSFHKLSRSHPQTGIHNRPSLEPLDYPVEDDLPDLDAVVSLVPVQYKTIPVDLHYAGELEPPKPLEEEDFE